jgi:hypothetical protein
MMLEIITSYNPELDLGLFMAISKVGWKKKGQISMSERVRMDTTRKERPMKLKADSQIASMRLGLMIALAVAIGVSTGLSSNVALAAGEGPSHADCALTSSHAEARLTLDPAPKSRALTNPNQPLSTKSEHNKSAR